MQTPDPHGAADAWWEDEHANSPGHSRVVRLLESRWSWLVVGAVAFLIFEATSSASLAMAMGCLKFGWHDLWMARKLKRADPNRARGRTVARFTTAWGMLKVCLIATLMMFVILFVEEAARGPGANGQLGGPPETFITAAAICMVGWLLSCSVSMLGVVSALRNRVKVWVGGRENRAPVVLFCALTAFGTFALFPLLAVVIAVCSQLGVGRDFPAIPFMIVLALIAVPGGILATRDYFLLTIVARTPEECWPEPLDLNAPRRKRARWHEPEADRGFVID